MEQFIFMNDVLNLLKEQNIEVTFHKVGNYMTSLDMEGVSLTLIDLEDETIKDALESEVTTISW